MFVNEKDNFAFKKVTVCCEDCKNHIQFCVKPHVNYIVSLNICHQVNTETKF